MQKIQYKIYGGNKVSGIIKCKGAKNLTTKVLMLLALTNKVMFIQNIPQIKEINITIKLLLQIGIIILVRKERIMIYAKEIKKSRVISKNTYINRITIFLLNILFKNNIKGYIPKVIGDKIGSRKVDYHIIAICKYGGEFYETKNEYISLRKYMLLSSKTFLQYPSVGATENCLFLSMVSSGISIINNIAIEPEIIELISILKKIGLIVLFFSNRKIILRGMNNVKKAKLRIFEDRVEAISWFAISYILNGELKILSIKKSIVKNFLICIDKIGCQIYYYNKNYICINNKKKPIKLETKFYPGFSTDFQQVICIILTKLKGVSIIHETVYEKRFKYISILRKIGVKIKILNICIRKSKIACRYRKKGLHSVIIYGQRAISISAIATKVKDLRGGMANLIKLMMIRKKIRLNNTEEIERGYGNMVKKIIGTNIKIRRINVKKSIFKLRSIQQKN